MEKLKIDMHELMWAFESCSIESRYFLDIKTGEVIFTSDLTSTQEEQEEFEIKIDADPQRYIPIPEEDSRQAYDDMVDFTNTVKDKTLQDKLEIALNGKGAFRRFKDVLIDYPQERQQWFDFKNVRIGKRIKMWLEENEIEISEAG
jgi:hypothetical protein